MNLIIDIGNTLIKIAVFQNGKMLMCRKEKSLSIGQLDAVLKDYNCDKAIISNVKNYDLKLEQWLHKQLDHLLVFNAKTSIPFENEYLTKSTLGRDRLAGVAGAHHLFHGANVLIVDMGTCITYDLLTAHGVYKGGGISPGLQMRLKALNHFTGSLPLIHFDIPEGHIGKDTSGSIRNGVYWGIAYEMEGFIESYKSRFDHLKVVITGGDSKHFESIFKSGIFAVSNLVLTGLNKILDYNAE